MTRGSIGAVALVMLVAVQPVVAQAIPGGHPRDTELRHLQRRMEYRADVLDQLNEMMDAWRDAWAADQPEELAALYTDDAVLLPPGEAPIARGRESVMEFRSHMFGVDG